MSAFPRLPPAARVSPRRLLIACAVAATGVAATIAIAPASAARSPARVLERSFHSRAVRGTLRYRVFLPAGYTSGRRYPVIYLLGGLPDGGTNFRDPRVRRVGIEAERHGRPAIVVAPQASRRGDTDPEFHDWGPGRNWESAIATDLVRAVDARFRTIRSRRARALIGVSAGGYGAAIIAVHHPRTFSLAQAWSGYFYPTDPSGTERLSVGGPAANRRASVHSYVGWLGRTHAVRLEFYVGASDPDFLGDNRRLHHELSKARVPHRFAVYPGSHSGGFWIAHEDAWVADAVSRLAPATPPVRQGGGGSGA